MVELVVALTMFGLSYYGLDTLGVEHSSATYVFSSQELCEDYLDKVKLLNESLSQPIFELKDGCVLVEKV